MVQLIWGMVGIVGCAGTGSTADAPKLSDLSWEHNPHFLGPFTVTWRQSAPGIVAAEYQVDGDWLRTPDLEGQAGINQATVIGVPLGQTAPWRMIVADGSAYDGDEDLVGLDVPEGLPVADVQADDEALWASSGAYVLLPINGFDSAFYVIMDRRGRTIWATGGSNLLYSELSASGDGLLWGDTTRDEAYRAYLDEPIATFAVPGHYHALAGLPDGSIVWDSASTVFEMGPDETEGTPVWSSNAFSYINGITYDPATDQLGISSFSSQSIALVDRNTGTVSFSAPGIEGTPVYAFQPSSSVLNNQHGIELLDNGNLLASTIDNATGTVWLREYVIDTEFEALREVWHFDSGTGDVSWSWAHRLANGSNLHTLGPGGRLYEVTADGAVAWRVRYPGYFLGRAQVIDDLYAWVAP